MTKNFFPVQILHVQEPKNIKHSCCTFIVTQNRLNSEILCKKGQTPTSRLYKALSQSNLKVLFYIPFICLIKNNFYFLYFLKKKRHIFTLNAHTTATPENQKFPYFVNQSLTIVLTNKITSLKKKEGARKNGSQTSRCLAVKIFM